jgi:hypothetical protein
MITESSLEKIKLSGVDFGSKFHLAEFVLGENTPERVDLQTSTTLSIIP